MHINVYSQQIGHQIYSVIAYLKFISLNVHQTWNTLHVPLSFLTSNALK